MVNNNKKMGRGRVPGP